MNEVDTLRREILSNQKKFAKLEAKVSAEPDLSRRCELAYEAAVYAAKHATDVYASEVLEAPFLELAEKCSIELPEAYEPGTVLHVMTEAYTTGGHTRCVERWMNRCPEYRHSCVLLRQQAVVPGRLLRQVEESGGVLECYDAGSSMLSRALKLRRYAAGFEYVVLHIHMDDPIALIAFGTRAFKRPVVFFNHADHAFWLGVSVADCVADWNSGALVFSREKRGAARAVFLGIPQDDTPALSRNYTESRRELGIAEGAKLIFVSGLASKFAPLEHPSYEDIVTDVVAQNPNIVFYVAGPRAGGNGFWGRLQKKFPKNLVLTGHLNYATEYPRYLACADLVVDSYPVGGGTALCDAVKAGKPVVTLSRELQSDYLLTSEAACHSYEEFLSKIHRILADADYAATVREDVYERFRAETSPEAWHGRCADILTSLPAEHDVHTFCRQPLGYDVTSLALKTFGWLERRKSFASLRKAWCRLFAASFKPREKKLVLFGVPLLHERSYVCDAAERMRLS